MIDPPQTYLEWTKVLDMLKNKQNDDEVLQAMLKGKLVWQTGVADRFAKRLTDTINYRMNQATERFQKELNRGNGQEMDIVNALLGVRKEFAFLAKAINLPVIPLKDRNQYHQLVLSQADSIQASLEESAKKDRTGKLLSIIRNNRVNDMSFYKNIKK